MQAVYLSTNGDTTTILSTPLEVQGYGCGVIELNGKVLVPKKLLRSNKIKQPEKQPIPEPPEKSEENEEMNNSTHDELTDQTQPVPTNEGFTDNLYLCSDIVEESDVGNIKMPVLRYLKRKNGIPVEINNVIWLNVMRPSISRIRLYIADETGKILSLPKNTLNCTLLFIPA